MTTIDEILSIQTDGRTVTADDMRHFISAVKRHLHDTKSTANAAELLALMSALECLEYLDSDSDAEAMRRGFRLALYVSRFDFPIVQRAIARERQRVAAKIRHANNADRDAAIIADYRAMRESVPEHKIAGELAKKHKKSAGRIREIIRPYRS